MTQMTGTNAALSIDDHVRGLQLRRVERNIAPGLLVFLSAGSLLCLFLWQEWWLLLGPWAFMTLILGAIRQETARRALMRPLEPCSPGGIWSRASVDVALAIVIPVPSVWILFHSEGMIAVYMSLAAVGVMWAGALIHISMFPVAATFIAIQMALWIGAATFAGWNQANAILVVLFCLTGSVAILVGQQLSKWLEYGFRQRLLLKAQTSELRRQNETVSLLLREHEDESSDWLWQTDAQFLIQNVSPRFATVFDRPAHGLEGHSPTVILRAPSVEGNEEACRTLDNILIAGTPFRDLIIPGAVGGSPRWWSVSGRPTHGVDDGVTGYRGVMADVTQEHRAKAEVFHLAHFDPLTDLPNRPSLLQRLEGKLRNLGNSNIAVLYLDLDGFKLVNDRYGHAIGDALLVAVAERLQAATSNTELVARLSGDEFVVKTRKTDPSELEALCKRLVRDIGRPFVIQGLSVNVGASLGVAVAPVDGTTAGDLLKSADAALYRAKHSGGSTYRFFASALDNELQERAELLQDLRNALPRNEFVLHYQPFVNATSGAITGYEALIRWRHPRRGLVSPLDFVPLAEEHHLIVPIGAWVIHAACLEAAKWDNDRRVSVNVSPVQFHDRQLPERILEALVETGLSPHRLEIELTESIFVSDIDQALTMLRRIRALGVRVALDDFGTGYSSLSYLQSFPFDKIKIDRSFVRDLATRPHSQVIVRAVGDIARGLNMTITAEGVETNEQAALLQTAGCHELQGYLYGRPEPADRGGSANLHGGLSGLSA